MLGGAGSAGGLHPVLTPWGLSSQCTKDSDHWGWDSVTLVTTMSLPIPNPRQEPHWEAAWDHNDPSAAPPANAAREWQEDKSTMPRPSGSPQPSPGLRPRVLRCGMTCQAAPFWAESQALSSRNPRLRRPESPCTRRGRVCTFLERRQFPNLLPVSEASVSIYVPFFLHPRVPLAGTSAVSLSSGGTCWAFPVEPSALG